MRPPWYRRKARRAWDLEQAAIASSQAVYPAGEPVVDVVGSAVARRAAERLSRKHNDALEAMRKLEIECDIDNRVPVYSIARAISDAAKGQP